jgi:hypothetical protein
MRIISDWHDYYDSVQQHGQDQTVIYERKQVVYYEKEEKTWPELIRKISKLSNQHRKNSYYSSFDLPNSLVGKKESFNVSVGDVIFCGKIYHYVALTNNVGKTEYAYHLEDIIQICNFHGIDTKRKLRWSMHSLEIKLQKHFEPPTVNREWLIENKVICTKITGDVIINPSLKDIDFFKVKDTYQTYQELDVWISGTLSYPQNTMVTLDDKSMLVKHGFDKWSFKTLPTKRV